jgi:hypothetical protein
MDHIKQVTMAALEHSGGLAQLRSALGSKGHFSDEMSPVGEPATVPCCHASFYFDTGAEERDNESPSQ